MKSYPPDYIATLAAGLRDNSRIKMKLSGMKTDINTLLLARVADNTALNVYIKTKDAKHGRNKPKSIVKTLTEVIPDSQRAKVYASGEDFLRDWENS